MMKTTPTRPTTTPTQTTPTTHPEVQQKPQRSGVLGTILTEVEFGNDESVWLQNCADVLEDSFETIVDVLADRARQVALDSETYGVNAFPTVKSVRPSIRNLRRHAARQWWTATLAGTFDAAFSRQLRHTWMPILLADPQHTRASGATVAAFLDYVEGYVASLFVDGVEDNLVPSWCRLHALRTALDVQRRIFGLPRRSED